jgi:UDP-N-acetylmuramyl pentapeptide phosphotransferase/UDP-N-acetylglucosamine-1-phosphate transferase
MQFADIIGPAAIEHVLLAAFIGSALLAVVLIVLLMPLLRRYALARPNARSSHRTPTPQGGGIAVVAAALLPVAAILLAAGPDFTFAWGGGHAFGFFWLVAGATVGLAVLGAIDDIRPLPVLPRLLLQALAVSAVVMTGRTVFDLPHWIEVPLLVLAGLWFVNLTNFMDGLDCSSAHPCVGACSVSPCSTSPSHACFSATWARCRSGCLSAGCCWSWPGRGRSPPRFCCPCTIWPMRP